MNRLIASEFQRIWKNRQTILLLLFCIVSTIIACIWRYAYPAGSYDAVNYNVELNRLNFAPFIFYGVRLELMYIILPIMYINSISHEIYMGAFRIYATRPYKKHEFIISKIIALALVTFIFVFIVFAISTIFGYLFMPKVSKVKFYNIQHEFSMMQAFLYTIKFYIIQFVICLCVLGLSVVIGTIISNFVISIFAIIASIIALGFHTKLFEFINYTTTYGFYALGNNAPISFYISLGMFLTISLVISTFLWRRKDYLC